MAADPDFQQDRRLCFQDGSRIFIHGSAALAHGVAFTHILAE